MTHHQSDRVARGVRVRKLDLDAGPSRFLLTELAGPAQNGAACAGVAQSVEHVLGKDGVTGSIPVSSSMHHVL